MSTIVWPVLLVETKDDCVSPVGGIDIMVSVDFLPGWDTGNSGSNKGCSDRFNRSLNALKAICLSKNKMKHY